MTLHTHFVQYIHVYANIFCLVYILVLYRSIDSAAIRSHYDSTMTSHDFLRPHPLRRHHRPPSPASVAEANARVTHWMRTLGRRNRYRKLVSRSISNLSELREEEEDEVVKRSVKLLLCHLPRLNKLWMNMYVYMCPTRGSSFFLGKVTALGVLYSFSLLFI